MFSHRTTTGMLLASLAARPLVAAAKGQVPTPDDDLN